MAHQSSHWRGTHHAEGLHAECRRRLHEHPVTYHSVRRPAWLCAHVVPVPERRFRLRTEFARVSESHGYRGPGVVPDDRRIGICHTGRDGYRHNAFMTYSALTSLTKVVGSHNIKIGWDFRLLRVNDHESSSGSGNFSFGTNFTQGPNPSTASSTAGNGLASLLLGTDRKSVVENFKDDAAQSYYFAWFVQDDWRVSRKLTLNLGLRYDLDTPRTDRYNRMNYFDRTVVYRGRS